MFFDCAKLCISKHSRCPNGINEIQELSTTQRPQSLWIIDGIDDGVGFEGFVDGLRPGFSCVLAPAGEHVTDDIAQIEPVNKPGVNNSLHLLFVKMVCLFIRVRIRVPKR